MKHLIYAMTLCLAAQSVFGEDKPIPASEAAGRAGEKATVEFKVLGGRLLEQDNPVCFLNSKKNHRENDNFTVVMFSKALERFKEKDIKNPSEHFMDKTIRVTGEIGLRQGKPQIILDYPDQIEVVEKSDENE